MEQQKDAKPIEKITETVQKAARAESEPAHVRRYRAVMFQIALVIIACSFGVLTFLVKTMPSFSIDLQITKAIQMINSPLLCMVDEPGKLAGFWSTII